MSTIYVDSTGARIKVGDRVTTPFLSEAIVILINPAIPDEFAADLSEITVQIPGSLDVEIFSGHFVTTADRVPEGVVEFRDITLLGAI